MTTKGNSSRTPWPRRSRRPATSLTDPGRRRAARWLALLAAAGLLAGCSARRTPTAAAAAPALTEADVRELLAEAARTARAVRRYEAVLDVRGSRAEGRFSGRLLFVFARPEDPGASAPVEALRMEAFAPVGGSRWSLVARPGRVRVVAPSERAFAEGRDLTEFSEPVLGVSVGIEEVVALLVGIGAPVGDPTLARPVGGGGAMRLAAGPVLWWDRSAAAPQVRRVEGARYRATYAGDWRSEGRQVPRRFEVSSSGVEATLEVEELRVNAELHPEAFRLQAVPGFRQVTIRELARSLVEARERRGNSASR